MKNKKPQTFWERKTEHILKKGHTMNVLNTPYLLIVESPSKCAKIEKYLGFQYKCIASKGHICSLKNTPSQKNQFVSEFEIIPEKRTVVDVLKSYVSQVRPENIFLATDDDREGEAIAWHICNECNLSIEKTHRILFHEITPHAIQYAIKHPIHIRMDIVRAQQARQIIDRLIGFRISPVLTKMITHDSSFLSAGRCQTPILKMIYDQYVENNTKTTGMEYQIRGVFFTYPSNIFCTLNKNFETEAQVLRFFELSKSYVHVFDVDTIPTEKEILPPIPFNTSGLLQYASTHLHFSPTQTMAFSQILYQEGFITYMRTESVSYAKSFTRQVTEYITGNYGELYTKEQEETTDNPHEAIRVTNILVAHIQSEMSEPIKKLYHHIWTRCVESCMNAYTFKRHVITISAPDKLFYKYDIDIPTHLGWKRNHVSLKELVSQQEATTSLYHYVHHIDGDIAPFQKLTSHVLMKERNVYFTEANLIKKMEDMRIGRPSTYSILVETVQERKYVSLENMEGISILCSEHCLELHEITTTTTERKFGESKNKLVIQELGLRVIKPLYAHFEPLFCYEYTRQMEAELDKIASDLLPVDENWRRVCIACEELIQHCTVPLKEKMNKKYPIDVSHRVVFGKTGATIQFLLEDGTTGYKSIKQNIDLDMNMLENGMYKLEDLLEIPAECLGVFEGSDLLLKKGPYGAYVKWGDQTQNINTLYKKKKGLIGYADIVTYLDTLREKKKSKIIREINKTLSVRKGKYGTYLHYNPNSDTPVFINTQKCPLNALECDANELMKWVENF
jgi:DNA topoisomerase-1